MNNLVNYLKLYTILHIHKIWGKCESVHQSKLIPPKSSLWHLMELEYSMKKNRDKFPQFLHMFHFK